jgi:hypothetical protein
MTGTNTALRRCAKVGMEASRNGNGRRGRK